MLVHPQVSIIVPVYNCGARTEFSMLVESALGQSFGDFELILCDDGSEDNTLEICRMFARKDPRVKVVGCPHSGVSATRNTGIEHATGRWITFVDADDRLLPEFLAALVSHGERAEEIDLVFGSYAIAGRNGCGLKVFHPGVWRGKEEIRNLLCVASVLERCSPWAKLFRRSVVMDNGLRFDTRLSHSEDRHFIYRYLRNVRGIALSGTVGYVYGDFSGASLKYRKHSPEKLLLRQRLITEEGMALLRHYAVPAENSFGVGRNLMHLLQDACVAIGESSADMSQKIMAQKELREMCMGHDTGSVILADERTVAFVRKSLWLPKIINGNLKDFNRRLNAMRRSVKVKQKIKQILGFKDAVGCFESCIDVLN